MFTSLRALCFCATLTIAASASGQVNIVNFDFGAVPILCAGDYAYQGPFPGCTYLHWPFQSFNSTPGFGWTLSGIPGTRTGGCGLTGPNTSFVPPPFTGLPFTQALALQGPNSFAWQVLEGFSAGSYTLSFYLGSRFIDCCGYDGNQTVQALIDGNVIGTWALSSFTPFTLETVPFSVSAGSHTLMLKGINYGDHTAFLSYVVITRTQR
jgi:hypothetical protein